MRQRALFPFCLSAVISITLLVWGVAVVVNILEKEDRTHGKEKFEIVSTTVSTPAKCGLSKSCPPQHFALSVSSGAANIIGPQICFDDKIIMSQVLNNVGLGLNMVQVNGENGTVENISNLNFEQGNVLEYLTAIKPGTIVLVASHGDVASKMTEEMKEVFVGLGSSMIKSIKLKDNWAFVGRAGSGRDGRFEKLAPNDPKTNAYGQWPAMVQVGGCFPRRPHGQTG